MDMLLLCSCMNHMLKTVEVDTILKVAVMAVDENIMNTLLLPLTQKRWILWMRLRLSTIILRQTVVVITDEDLVVGPMVGVALDSLGHYDSDHLNPSAAHPYLPV